MIVNFDDYSTQYNAIQPISYTNDSFDTKIFDFTSEIDFTALNDQPYVITTPNTIDQTFEFNQTDFLELPLQLTSDYEIESSTSCMEDSSYTKSYSSLNPVKSTNIYYELNSVGSSNNTSQDNSLSNSISSLACVNSYIADSNEIISNCTSNQSFDFTPYIVTSSDPMEITEEQSQVFQSLLDEPISDSTIEQSVILIGEDDSRVTPYAVEKPSDDLKKKCKEHLIELDRQKRTRKCSHLWQFCACLLDDDLYNPSLIKWLNIQEGIFKIMEPDRVAELWGDQKTRRFDKKMTYEKMARGMRYSRSEGFFRKIEKEKNKPNEYGKQFVFQFSDKVVKNFVWKFNMPKE